MQRTLRVYAEAVKALPPPANPTKEQAHVYLTELENVRREIKASEASYSLDVPSSDPRVITKALFKFADNQLRKIPNPKMRLSILNNVTGMLLKQYELSAVSVVPKPVPQDFLTTRGRPKEGNGKEQGVSA